MKNIILMLLLMMGVSLMAQTNKEKTFNKEHKALIKEYIKENKAIKRWYKCKKIKDDTKQQTCYLKQEKEVVRNLKWFDRKEKKLIKKFGDGMSVFAYKY